MNAVEFYGNKSEAWNRSIDACEPLQGYEFVPFGDFLQKGDLYWNLTFQRWNDVILDIGKNVVYPTIRKIKEKKLMNAVEFYGDKMAWDARFDLCELLQGYEFVPFNEIYQEGDLYWSLALANWHNVVINKGKNIFCPTIRRIKEKKPMNASEFYEKWKGSKELTEVICPDGYEFVKIGEIIQEDDFYWSFVYHNWFSVDTSIDRKVCNTPIARKGLVPTETYKEWEKDPKFKMCKPEMGYEFVKIGEIIQEGDLVWSYTGNNWWAAIASIGKLAVQFPVIRKIKLPDGCEFLAIGAIIQNHDLIYSGNGKWHTVDACVGMKVENNGVFARKSQPAVVKSEFTQGSVEFVLRDNFLYLFSDNPPPIPHLPSDVCWVDKKAYEKVKAFVDLFKSEIVHFMKEDEEGNIPYWEQEMHSSIVNFLYQLMPKVSKGNISNALSMLGY